MMNEQKNGIMSECYQRQIYLVTLSGLKSWNTEAKNASIAREISSTLDFQPRNLDICPRLLATSHSGLSSS